MNLQRIIYLSEAEYETLVSDGTITKDNRTIVYSENDLYITPSTDAVQFYPTADFPAIGEEGKLYYDTDLSKLYVWSNTDGYTELFVPVYTSASEITSWSAGATTQLAVDSSAPTLNVTAGTLPSLQYTNKNVVSNLTTQLRGE